MQPKGKNKSLECKRDFLGMLVYLAAGREMNVEDYLATLAVEEERRKNRQEMPTTGWFRVNKYRPISGSGGTYVVFPIKTVTVNGGYCHGTDMMKVACRSLLTKGWYHPDQEAFPLVEHVEFKPEEQNDSGLIIHGSIREVSETALHQAHEFALSLLVPAVQKVDDYMRIHKQIEKG